ncbi:MAG: bacteriohemerythrin [Candidatus Gracilibacteria bacterium]|jgi:hemerythrin-like metal-binding protein
MDRFIWTKEYSVGIELIDNQHKHFFEITNNILDYADQKDLSNRNEIVNLINDLGNYALYHLSTEEEYFDKFKYPDAPAHIEAHNNFKKTAKALFDEVIKADTNIKATAQKAALFAGSWLFQHILSMDKKYSQFFIDHGLTAY